MIGWSIFNLALAHQQYLALGRVTIAMVLVNVFQVGAGANAFTGSRLRAI
jgi:hypothetical protein